MHKEDILKRVEELLLLPFVFQDDGVKSGPELAQGTSSLLTLIYGKESTQLAVLNRHLDEAEAQAKQHNWAYGIPIIKNACQGALRNLKREIEGGLTGSLRQQIAGEVLTDLIQLARVALDEEGGKAKNVAAVLAAAAFEDTIRRMDETFAGVIEKDDLPEVLKKLKDAGVIQTPQIGIAQSYLNFRNHALHANWDKIEKESIQSALGFVEQLLLKHFS